MAARRNITKVDPSRTGIIRRQFSRDMSRRFDSLSKAIVELVQTDDAFGLQEDQYPIASINLGGGRRVDLPLGPRNAGVKRIWAFKTSVEKVQEFQKWLKTQVDQKILSTDAKGDPWTAKYIYSAYKQGLVRSFNEALKKTSRKKERKIPGFLGGMKEEFLRKAFDTPEQLQKVKLLGTRSFEDLKGVTSQMAAKMNRILADGIAGGRNPRVIARELAKGVKGLSKSRALTIARTEVIHAQAEGQLDGFEELGVDEVGVFAEWSTAQDEDVCQLCEELEGAIFTIEEARGLLPRHPNCRCAWIPAQDVKKKAARAKMLKKVAKSLKKEGKKSTWAGKRLAGKKK